MPIKIVIQIPTGGVRVDPDDKRKVKVTAKITCIDEQGVNTERGIIEKTYDVTDDIDSIRADLSSYVQAHVQSLFGLISKKTALEGQIIEVNSL